MVNPLFAGSFPRARGTSVPLDARAPGDAGAGGGDSSRTGSFFEDGATEVFQVPIQSVAGKAQRRSKVFVIGHRRPDTDSAVAAAVYARLKGRIDRACDYEGILLDDPGPQATWLFETAGVPLPAVVEGVHTTVADIARRDITTVTTGATLGDAIRVITTDRVSTVPVVDEGGVLAGILSDRLPNCNYFYHFNVEDFLGVLFQLADLVRGLRLDEWKAPAREANGRLTMEASAVGQGDVLLTTSDKAAVIRAFEGKAAAVIVCDGGRKSAWSGTLRRAADTGVYRFKGSLLALASQLSMCIPVVNAMATEFPVLTPDQSLKEIHGQVSHTNYSLPVVGEGGRLIGLISRSDLLDAARPRVILVDHFETHQAAPGIEDCEVVEIVDHHRVGSLETHSPIRVDCRPVGSTATIIACKFEEAGLAPSKAEARLLLGAMVSDTLLLTSPTTTDTDRLWARQLAKRAGVDLRQFGRDVLVRNDETLTKRPEDLIGKDLKEFGAGALRFGVAQVETVDRTRLEPGRLAEFAAAIGLRRAREGWAFLAVMITDVLRGDSLVFIDDPDVRRRKHLLDDREGNLTHCLWAGCVSRKKQFLPAVLARLEDLKK